MTNKKTILTIIVTILVICLIPAIYLFITTKSYLYLSYFSFEPYKKDVVLKQSIVSPNQLVRAEELFKNNNDSFYGSLFGPNHTWQISKFDEGIGKNIKIEAVQTYGNLPIYNINKTWDFDKVTGRLINHMSSGNEDPLTANNFKLNKDQNINYQQAFEISLKNSKALSSKYFNKKGYTADLGLLVDKNYKDETYSGRLVWKISSNTYRIGFWNMGTTLGYIYSYAYIDASTGAYICDGGKGKDYCSSLWN